MNKLLKLVAVTLSLLFILCGCSSQTGVANNTVPASTSVPAATVYTDSSATNNATENNTTTNNTMTTPSTDNPTANNDVKKLTDTVVSKSQYDINNDGIKEDIEIVLSDGVFNEDRELCAGNGPKWIEIFLFVLFQGKRFFHHSH